MSESPFLIAGLGNPGEEYLGTRHNVGFFILDQFASHWKVTFRREREAKGKVASLRIKGVEVFFLKPSTFMNLSGESVSSVMRQKGVSPGRFIIITDDVDLSFGTLRFREKGGAGGHNGLKSVASHLGTDHFTRLRVGIGPHPGQELSDYVLGPFSEEEKTILPQVGEGSLQVILYWLEGEINRAMEYASGWTPSNPRHGD